MEKDLTILAQNKPQIADFLNLWRKKYERTYDMSQSSEQAVFYEGVLEMTRHMAVQSTNATLKLIPTSQGAEQLVIAVEPK